MYDLRAARPQGRRHRPGRGHVRPARHLRRRRLLQRRLRRQRVREHHFLHRVASPGRLPASPAPPESPPESPAAPTPAPVGPLRGGLARARAAVTRIHGSFDLSDNGFVADPDDVLGRPLGYAEESREARSLFGCAVLAVLATLALLVACALLGVDVPR